ncbi:MAG: hypothetical protein V8R40_07740, partial [Dysosmobacter sp.]
KISAAVSRTARKFLAQDLENASMSITEAEKKIKAFADGHKTGSFACVTPGEADDILREFYGLGTPRRHSRGKRLSENPESGGFSVRYWIWTRTGRKSRRNCR